MKKIIALLLVCFMALSAFVMTSCTDPLQAKADELDKAFAEMGQAYYDIYKLGALAGVLGNKDTSLNDQTLQKKLDGYKVEIKDAKDVVSGWLDLSEEEMDDYIEQWNEITEELKALCEQFDGVESFLDETTAD